MSRMRFAESFACPASSGIQRGLPLQSDGRHQHTFPAASGLRRYHERYPSEALRKGEQRSLDQDPARDHPRMVGVQEHCRTLNILYHETTERHREISGALRRKQVRLQTPESSPQGRFKTGLCRASALLCAPQQDRLEGRQVKDLRSPRIFPSSIGHPSGLHPAGRLYGRPHSRHLGPPHSMEEHHPRDQGPSRR